MNKANNNTVEKSFKINGQKVTEGTETLVWKTCFKATDSNFEVTVIFNFRKSAEDLKSHGLCISIFTVLQIKSLRELFLNLFKCNSNKKKPVTC